MEFNGERELKEEINKIEKMNGFERLRYIKELALFYRQIDMYSEESFKDFIERLLIATKGY
jgi:hypothetical protein